jgi:chromosome segregation ATPase
MAVVDTPGEPRDPPSSSPDDPGSEGSPQISEAAERARERLHEEIERVRAGVEELLVEADGEVSADLRSELERLRVEGRRYAKRRVGKSEKRLERSIDDVDRRLREFEQRFQAFAQERQYAEWRIHTNTEKMLDCLLREVRTTADLLSRDR